MGELGKGWLDGGIVSRREERGMGFLVHVCHFGSVVHVIQRPSAQVIAWWALRTIAVLCDVCFWAR
jgi:hypothetical protein